MEDPIKMAKDTEKLRELLFRAEEESDSQYAMCGLDELASIGEYLDEMRESIESLADNPLLDKDSKRMLDELYNSLGTFFQTGYGHIEGNLSNYIEEDD